MMSVLGRPCRARSPNWSAATWSVASACTATHEGAGALKGNTITGRLWVYVRDDRPCVGARPTGGGVLLLAIAPTSILAGYAAILQADAYAGFADLYDGRRKPGPITEAAYWSLSRHKLFERAAQGPPLAVEAVRRIGRALRHRAPDQRRLGWRSSSDALGLR
jgi:transposase